MFGALATAQGVWPKTINRNERTRACLAGDASSFVPEYAVGQAFKTQEYNGREQAELYRLRFLSNVDPVDVRRTLYDLDPEETLVVVISKTFTTAETMLNARFVPELVREL